MLEGKFKDETHPRCGYPLWKVKPVGIVIRGTEYMAKCPRCLFYLPVVDVVDPDAPPEPEPSPEPEVIPEALVEVEMEAELPAVEVIKPVATTRKSRSRKASKPTAEK